MISTGEVHLNINFYKWIACFMEEIKMKKIKNNTPIPCLI